MRGKKAKQERREGKRELGGEPKGVHVSELTPGAIFSLTTRGVQGALSNNDPRFRGPLNHDERRAWDKWWKLKGRGFTKPDGKRRNRG